MSDTAAFREHFFSAEDGLRLHAREYGAHRPGVLPVICLAGLTRNCRDFDALARLLATDADTPRHVFALDYRGRGESGHDPDWKNYNPMTEARDVATALTVFGIERAAFIGTSRTTSSARPTPTTCAASGSSSGHRPFRAARPRPPP